MNLPNRLTVARIAMVPLFALAASLAVESPGKRLYLAAGLIFALASITDLLDGKIARSRNLVTNFGKFADPLADKILTTAAFLYMQAEGVCSPVVLLLILTREFAVAGLRMIAVSADSGAVIAANIWGKVKTVAQMTAVVAVIIIEMLGSLLSSLGIGFPHDIAFFVETLLLWTSAAATVVSGAVYAAKGKAFFADA